MKGQTFNIISTMVLMLVVAGLAFMLFSIYVAKGSTPLVGILTRTIVSV
ncbi:MAG TPA: hypothetical protein VI979_00960 [archaeon]|nr:hypothetical protein [archaeon]